ncbi:hypothetical protein WR25_09557 [Diploscapter pachys]|uniref:glucuronosyltransferase n=1 Tax=Diploscapter pachys TaxID=2018661 RepID=A0A2A2KX98_9BILA|nr:hypothetical protein WR25_09557 [Diploscapter pachys]
MPTISKAIGEPQLISHVPTILANFGDKMNLFQKLKNLMGYWFGLYFRYRIYNDEIGMVENVVGKKDYSELLSKTSFVFVNSHPYLDFPFPALPKSVLIGGITVSPKAKKAELPEV